MQYNARRDADLAGLPPMSGVGLDELLRTSDVIVCCEPHDDNARLLKPATLRSMKNTAILINMARGASSTSQR